MKRSLTTLALFTVTILSFAPSAEAQWGRPGRPIRPTNPVYRQNNGGYVQGGNYWNQSQTDYQRETGFHSDRPGLAIAGGILNAVGGAVAQKDPTAGQILGGVGGSLFLGSNPNYYDRQQINQQQQGGFNTYQFGGYPQQQGYGGYQNGFNNGWGQRW